MKLEQIKKCLLKNGTVHRSDRGWNIDPIIIEKNIGRGFVVLRGAVMYLGQLYRYSGIFSTKDKCMIVPFQAGLVVRIDKTNLYTTPDNKIFSVSQGKYVLHGGYKYFATWPASKDQYLIGLSNGWWGIFSASAEQVVKIFRWKDVSIDWSTGGIIFRSFDRWGVYSMGKMKVVTPMVYEQIKQIYPGRAVFKRGRQWGVLSMRTGRELLPVPKKK